MIPRIDEGRPFGDLASLFDPRSVAVVGASDREGNLGGLAVVFLRKFGFAGHVWPVNARRDIVAGVRCYPSLSELPGVPDLVIVAVPAETVEAVVEEAIAVGAGSAVVWTGGFAEIGEEGRARQDRIAALCRAAGFRLCGPNCVGIVNSANGLTASFSSLLGEISRINPGSVSIVSQSGGIAVTALARAQELGLGFRATVSCGNEAVLGIPDFVSAFVEDEATRVIALYTEGLSDPKRLIDALAAAREREKPVVVLKGGASQTSARAALAHTGRLAGSDRTFDAILREFSAVRVHSVEEMLDACLQFAALRPGCVAAGSRVLISSFGGGSGVIGVDQAEREGLSVPPIDPETREKLKPIMTSLGSPINPVDLTPGSMTNPKHREKLREVMKTLVDVPYVDIYVLLSAGFGPLAPELISIFEDLRAHTEKPIVLSWLSPPAGTVEHLAARNVRAFDEHQRAFRAAGHLARYSRNRRLRIAQRPDAALDFDWNAVLGDPSEGVVTEEGVAAVLAAAGLAVAPGRKAATAEEAAEAAEAVGYPVVVKALSPQIPHRAAAGLVALNLADAETVKRTVKEFEARARDLEAAMPAVWVQHMVPGGRELIVTALRDRDFGVMVGCGIGGAMTEIVNDVAWARAPIDVEGAEDMLGCLRTRASHPDFLSSGQIAQAARFVARFSALVASAPWPEFTLEVNPLKVWDDAACAVDGLLVIG